VNDKRLLILLCECSSNQPSVRNYKKSLQDHSSGNTPPCVYLHVTTRDQISRLPHLYLRTTSNQRLEAGMAWRWGYTL